MSVPVLNAYLDDGSGNFLFDVTNYLDVSAGVDIVRGRPDEFGDVQPSTCSLTFDNSAGTFTPRAATRTTNLVGNGSFEVGAGGWTPSNATTATTTAQAFIGTKSLRITATTAAAATVTSDKIAVVAGSSSAYAFWFRIRAATLGNTFCAKYLYTDAFGVVVGSGTSTSNTDTTTGWTSMVYNIPSPPASAAYLAVVVQLNAPAAGEVHYVDAAYLINGTFLGGDTYQDPPLPIRVGCGLRVVATANSVATNRFTGYVNEWPVEWPGGNALTVTRVTASDQMARLGDRGRKFRSVVEETLLLRAPSLYYVLGEDEGALSAGDTSAYGNTALTVTQRGAGGTLDFGAGTGPGTDGHTAPVFTRASTTAGLYLGALYKPAAVNTTQTFFIHCTVNTSTAGVQTFVRLGPDTGYGIEIVQDASNRLAATMSYVGTQAGYSAAWTLTDTVSLNNGLTHDVLLVLTYNAGTFDGKLYKDGAQVASSTGLGPPGSSAGTALFIGGALVSNMASATISHVAVGSYAAVLADATEINSAVTTGFNTERSDQRIARYAKWAGLTSTVLETGSVTSIAHLDTTGSTVGEAMQKVTETENGLLFIDGTGRLTFHARAHRYGATNKVTLDAHDVGTDTRFSLDTQGLVNYVTASRTGGATQTYSNAASIVKYQQYSENLSLLVTTDDAALQAAAWRVSINGEPAPRLNSVTVDLLTQTASVAATVQALELGDRITVSGLPSQAPATSVPLFIEGWTERLSTSDWSLAFNTTPVRTVWVLESATYGAIDSTNRIAY